MKAEDKPWFKSWPSDVPKDIDSSLTSLKQLFEQSAKRYPKKTAIVFSDLEITYGQLNSASDSFASKLITLGIKKGDCVALFLPNIPQFIIAYCGILKIGAVFTAINSLQKEREVEYQLVDSGAKTIVTLDSLLPTIEALWDRTMLKTAVLTYLDEYSSGYHPSISPIAEKPNIYAFQDFLKPKVKPPEVAINPEDLAALQYTGGTTGTAKAAMLTHGNLVANAVAFASWIKGENQNETFLTALPLSHIYGLTTSLNVPMYLTAKMILLPHFEPCEALEIIQRQMVSVFCGVPTMYQAILASAELANFDLTSLRVCISGASSLPPYVQNKFMQVTGGLLVEGYGLTEASPVTHCCPVEKGIRTVKVGTIGLPLPGTDARIVDTETGKKGMPIGETGELAVKGPQVMKGYWKRPDETSSILREGWLLTGDIAHLDQNGYFYLTDRKKDLIKHKGYSVYPREIEDVLYEHPAVKICAVVGKHDHVAGEIPKAFVVLKSGIKVSEREIIKFVNGRVASYKAIRELEFRKSLPLSPVGKVLKRLIVEEEQKASFEKFSKA